MTKQQALELLAQAQEAINKAYVYEEPDDMFYYHLGIVVSNLEDSISILKCPQD